MIDKFFKSDSEIPIIEYHIIDQDKTIVCANWDTPSALHMELFNNHLSELKKIEKTTRQIHDLVSVNRPSVNEDTIKLLLSSVEIMDLLVKIKSICASKNIENLYLIDGFLLYSDPDPSKIFSLIDIPLFFHAPLSVLIERRNSRAAYKTTEGTNVLTINDLI